MSIERDSSSQEMGITQSEDQRVKNIEQAWIGAHAEKPIRDFAREEGISEEEKAIFDRLAKRRGEKAMQEYAAEKEKNPIERLLARMDKLAVEMRKKGLERDAVIAEEIKKRFNRYVIALKRSKEVWEEKTGRRVSLRDLQQASSDYKVSTRIPVTHQIGEGGGWFYSTRGFAAGWFSGTLDLEKYRKQFEEDGEQGLEVVNFSFSKQGEAEFYRALGVLGENEEAIDIPAIYEKAVREDNERRGLGGGTRIDPLNYEAYFPTNIEGVRLGIDKNQRRSYDGKKEERITIEFDDELIEQILIKK